MFKLNQSKTFSWPVKVSIPKDGGGYETGTFDAVFKRLTRTENEAMSAAISDGTLSGIDATRQVLVGWAGLVEDDGTEVPYSEANRDHLLNIPGVALAVFGVFSDANSGSAQSKN